MTLALPVTEQAFTEQEKLFLESEPPLLFPQNQNSYWGIARQVFSGYLQGIVNQMDAFYSNMDLSTVNATDMRNWEIMLGIPPAGTGRTLDARRAFVKSRFEKGPFTRSRRNRLIEYFIAPTFTGNRSIRLVPEGVPIPVGGIPIYSDASGFDVAPVEYMLAPTGVHGSSFNGYNIGAVFHLKSDQLLIELGRHYEGGATGTNRVGIYDGGSGALLAWVTASPTTPIVALTTPVKLIHGKSYVIGVEQQTGSGSTASRTATGMPDFLVLDDSAYVHTGGFVYPSLRDSQTPPIAEADNWMMGFKGQLYSVVENITNFSFDIRIRSDITIDEVGFNREMKRILPAHYSYTLTSTTAP